MRRTVCLYLDSGLLEEARKAAEARGASLSELAEEAISLYLQLLGRNFGRAPPRSARGRPAAEAPTARPPQPSAPSPPPPTTPPAAPPPPPTPPAPQLPPSAPPHLQNNAWVAVLRSRR